MCTGTKALVHDINYCHTSGAFAASYLADMAHSPDGGSINVPCADAGLKFTIYILLSQKRTAILVIVPQLQVIHTSATSPRLLRTRTYSGAARVELKHEVEDP